MVLLTRVVTVGHGLSVLGVLAVQGGPGVTPVAEVGVSVGHFPVGQRRRCDKKSQRKIKDRTRQETSSQIFCRLTFPGPLLFLLFVPLLFTFPPFLRPGAVLQAPVHHLHVSDDALCDRRVQGGAESCNRRGFVTNANKTGF